MSQSHWKITGGEYGFDKSIQEDTLEFINGYTGRKDLSHIQ